MNDFELFLLNKVDDSYNLSKWWRSSVLMTDDDTNTEGFKPSSLQLTLFMMHIDVSRESMCQYYRQGFDDKWQISLPISY